MNVRRFKEKLPGMRNIKTALCVFICLVINYLMRDELVLFSSIAAIVCMQSTIENTLKIGVNRLIGTAIGGGVGMLLVPIIANSSWDLLYLILMPLGIIVIIHLCNWIRVPGSAVICTIVYISVAVVPLSKGVSTDPYIMAINRIVDTAIGIVVAMVVNRFIVPPKFFEDREMHLACDTFASIREKVHKHLDGDEMLLLYDNALTNPKTDRFTRPARMPADTKLSINIPVPIEYDEISFIKTAYISSSFVVLPLNLRQRDGYVEIPGNFLPCTASWQFEEERKPALLPTIADSLKNGKR